MKDPFKKYEREFLKFDRVENKLSQRPDLHAFQLLDLIVPGDEDIVSDAQHDQIFLSVEPEALVRVATQDQLRDLHRCGVRYDESLDSLALFT